MNSRERFLAVTAFEPPDRAPIWEWGYWPLAIHRWRQEGLVAAPPQPYSLYEDGEAVVGGDYLVDVLGLDRFLETITLHRGPWPPFEKKVLDEDEETRVVITPFGSTARLRKDGASIPHFMDWPVKTRPDWEAMKERFHPSGEGRFPATWAQDVQRYRHRDFPVSIGGFPNGIFGLARELMGVHNLLVAFYDDPDLVHDIMNYTADFMVGIWEKALSEVDVDSVTIWEDMSYKSGSLISPTMFRTFMAEPYRKLTRFLRGHGITRIWVDTDGNCWELIPLFLECGVTGVFPFEVQAGMDVVEARRRYPRLLIRGGIDKSRLAQGKEAIDEELERRLPFMLKQGGYLPHLDHLVPPDVSWENYRYYIGRLAEMIRNP